MMSKLSAGILFYRFQQQELEVLLVHPGGPFWAKKNAGAWTIPKGEINENEAPFQTALREVEEETGIKAEGNFIELTAVKQKSGKLVTAWAAEFDYDPAQLISNTFEMEWPPKSGKKQTFPEVDKAAWFTLEEASKFIMEGQLPLIAELKQLLGG